MTDVAEKTQEIPTETPAAENETEKEATKSTEEISKLEADIIRQVEYYFGDANLNRDKFLMEQISKDEEGWVTFEVLLTFKRLASLSTDTTVIANALHKSDEGLVEISEDKTKIRRHPERPIPEFNEERRKEIVSRTLYVKGFPLDSEISDLIEFFNPYEKVVNITMRKYLDKPTKTYKFKGSVFLTFAKKEQAEEFLNKDKVVYKERDLFRKWQEAYLEEKKEERNAKSKKAKAAKEEEENKKFALPKGTVLHFEGASENTTRELIREAVEALEGEVAYIDFSKGDKEGQIRLQAENAAQAILDKLEDKKLKLKDDLELTLRTLTEDEEKEFLAKAVEHMKSRRNQQNRNKGHHGHHGHHGNRKRRNDDREKANGEPKAKEVKE